MSSHHHNPRLVKIHRSYTVEEIANLFGVHKNTVRQWIKQGLPVCDDMRPVLILGSDLKTFLKARRAKNKRPCQPGEIYCVRCRAPKKPAGGMAEYQPKTESLGNLLAICPDCYSCMNRRVNLAKLHLIQPHMDITLPLALRHMVEIDQPTVNSGFNEGAKS
jgi:excisionase family DNA binding protein